MTDKQSTVVVSRELLERLALPMEKTHKYFFDHRDALDELRALLAAAPDQSEQAVEPVGYLQTSDIDRIRSTPRAVYGGALFSPQAREGFEPLYRHAQPPAKSGPWEPLSTPGQITPGDWLHFTVGGKFICTRAKEILWAGTHREEVIYNRRQNHYFTTGMAVEGTSSHKGVMLAKP